MQSSKLLNQRSNQHIKLSKTSIKQEKCKAFKIQDIHTHTLNKSNQFYISKISQDNFSVHTLTHVFLVMAKSHCTCTSVSYYDDLRYEKINLTHT